MSVANTLKCSIDGCDKGSSSRGWCKMHYTRWLRSGDAGEAGRRKRVRALECCGVDGCDGSGRRSGYCEMHYARIKRHGDPHVVIKPAARGARNKAWRGDEVGYDGVHFRLRRQNGPARGFDCVDCGSQAAHWSYDYVDPNQKFDQSRNSAYSTDLSHYSPRCVPCHRVFDLAHGGVVA